MERVLYPFLFASIAVTFSRLFPSYALGSNNYVDFKAAPNASVPLIISPAYSQTGGGSKDQAGTRTPRDGPAVRYGVMLDAGSSSTKIKVYTYTPGALPSFIPTLKLVDSMSENTSLNNYVNDLDNLTEYLNNALRKAAQRVPRHEHAKTPVYLMATAGLRSLAAKEAQNLLDGIHTVLSNQAINPFHYKSNHISILSGEEEAVYAWLALNYLLGFFSSNMTREESVGVLEMGGGSMQIAFLPEGPILQEEFQVYVGRRRFDLYAQSYLNFGSSYIKREVRRRLQQDVSPERSKILHSPCMLEGDTDETQGEQPVKVVGTGNPWQCQKILGQILEPAPAWKCSPSPCAIGDRYQPAVGSMPFYAISAFTFASKSLQAIESGDKLNITKLRWKAVRHCNRSIEQARNESRNTRFASDDCLLGLYIPLLLTKSFGFPEDTRDIRVSDKIGKERIDWALGAMLQQLSMAFMDNLDSVISCRNGNMTLPLPKPASSTGGSQLLTPSLTSLVILLFTCRTVKHVL